jgi:hypothetical protein
MAVVEGLPGGERGVLLSLEEVEAALLQSLALQMVEFVAPRSGPNDDPLAAMVGIDPLAETPDDPALRRLLPDAFIDDPEAAGEFRRFTERDLREAKVRNAQSVLAELEGGRREVEVRGEAVSAWLGFLNDTRLTLGARLDLTEENHDELADLPDSDPRAGLFQVYDWLTFLQESLVQSLLPGA